MATVGEENNKFFINREGMPDASGVNMETIDDEYDLATAYNQKFGTNYKTIIEFNKYGKGIAVAEDNEGNKYFVNDKGKKSTVGVNIRTLSDSLRALYINQKNKTNYKTVGDFGYYGKDVAFARTYNNGGIFINIKGKPDITGIDPNEVIGLNSNTKAAYFNTINGTNFVDFYDTQSVDQTNIYFAGLPNGGYAFVNRKTGKPTLKVKNLQLLKNQYSESTVNEIIKNTKKLLSGELKENFSILHSIVNEELNNYFQN